MSSSRVCVHASCFSCVQLFGTPWTVAHQASLSMGLTRQEYWNGWPFPSPGDLPKPGLLHCRQILYPLSRQWSPSTSQGESPATDPSLTALRRHQPFQHFDLRLLDFITVRQIPVVWTSQGGFLGGAVVMTLLGAQVWLLVGELRFHKPCSVPKDHRSF